MNTTEPEYINTVVPIQLPLLKRAFSENIIFNVDVASCQLPAPRILNYISNVKVKCELVYSTQRSLADMVIAYMGSITLLNDPLLETMSLLTVMKSMGTDIKIDNMEEEALALVCEEIDPAIVNLWRIRLSCIEAWSMSSHSKVKHLVSEYPVDSVTYTEDGSLDIRGINFINVLASPLLTIWIPHIRREDILFNKELFESNIFASKNMFSYIGNVDNPYILSLFDIIEDEEDVPSS